MILYLINHTTYYHLIQISNTSIFYMFVPHHLSQLLLFLIINTNISLELNGYYVIFIICCVCMSVKCVAGI